jgi:hypothetical protein
MEPPSGVSVWAAGSFAPLGVAKQLSSFSIFLFPHFGQTGDRSGFTRLEKKLKIIRHFGQENS